MSGISYSMPRFQAIDMYGRPMVGATLYTYQNKTTTPAPTWRDKGQTAYNTNPIVLDARGEAVIWLASDRTYTFVLRDIFGVLVWSQDDVGSGSAGMVDFDQDATYPPGSIGEKIQQSVSTGNKRGGFAVAAVIRRDASVSPDWTTISDASHKPINWIGPSGSGVDQRVEFKSGPVASFIVCPDETFAKDGVTAGISGGNGLAVISMGAPCTFEADLEERKVSRYNTRYFSSVRFSVAINADSGLITLTHPNTFSHQRPIVQYQPKNSTGEVLIPHHVSSSGIGSGLTSLFLVGEAEGTIVYTGSKWELVASAWNSADVSFEYDNSLGVLRVNHPQVLLPGAVSPRVQVSLGGEQTGAYFLTAFDTTATSFKVRFRNHNNAVPTLNVNMGLYFSRGMTAPRKNPVGSIMVDVGRVHVAMNQVDAPSGNLWCLGINNLS